MRAFLSVGHLALVDLRLIAAVIRLRLRRRASPSARLAVTATAAKVAAVRQDISLGMRDRLLVLDARIPITIRPAGTLASRSSPENSE